LFCFVVFFLFGRRSVSCAKCCLCLSWLSILDCPLGFRERIFSIVHQIMKWNECCLFFFDIRILITPLVSSNSSYKFLICLNVYLHKTISLSSVLFCCNIIRTIWTTGNRKILSKSAFSGKVAIH
jgi:hypothetical protein